MSFPIHADFCLSNILIASPFQLTSARLYCIECIDVWRVHSETGLVAKETDAHGGLVGLFMNKILHKFPDAEMLKLPQVLLIINHRHFQLGSAPHSHLSNKQHGGAFNLDANVTDHTDKSHSQKFYLYSSPCFPPSRYDGVMVAKMLCSLCFDFLSIFHFYDGSGGTYKKMTE